MSPRDPAVNERMRDRSWRAIMRAGLELFAERGFAGVTVAEIAARAGVSKGLMYRHVRSKDELLQAIVADRLRNATSLLAQVEREASAAERLRQLVRLSLWDVVESRQEIRLYIALRLQPEGAPAVHAGLEELAAAVAGMADPVLEILRALGSTEPEREAELLQAILDGLALRLLIDAPAGPVADWIEASAQRVVALFSVPP